MAPLSILVSGGGITGPAVAYWLKRCLDCTITLVERAPRPRTSGQAVDIRGFGVDIMQAMGIESAVRAKSTTEEGVNFVNSEGKVMASFPASGDSKSQSFTSEYEILRGDLSSILLDAAKDCAEFVFDEYVAGIEDVEGPKVRVTFANGHLPTTEYDLVVAADGMMSKTRRLVFGKGPQDNDYLRFLGQYGAILTLPKLECDTKWAQWYSGAGGRGIFLRPDQYGTTRAYLMVTDKDHKRFDNYARVMHEGQEAQKKLVAEEFKDAGFQGKRIVDALPEVDDFYFTITGQVKVDNYYKGRYAMVGDTAYAPSPMTGLGTTSGLLGAYVLAGELSKSPDDIPKALANYQAVMKPHMEQVQKLPPGVPYVVFPQSKWGLSIFYTVIGVLAAGQKYFSKFFTEDANKSKWEPPKYPALMAEKV